MIESLNIKENVFLTLVNCILYLKRGTQDSVTALLFGARVVVLRAPSHLGHNRLVNHWFMTHCQEWPSARPRGKFSQHQRAAQARKDSSDIELPVFVRILGIWDLLSVPPFSLLLISNQLPQSLKWFHLPTTSPTLHSLRHYCFFPRPHWLDF